MAINTGSVSNFSSLQNNPATSLSSGSLNSSPDGPSASKRARIDPSGQNGALGQGGTPGAGLGAGVQGAGVQGLQTVPGLNGINSLSSVGVSASNMLSSTNNSLGLPPSIPFDVSSGNHLSAAHIPFNNNFNNNGLNLLHTGNPLPGANNFNNIEAGQPFSLTSQNSVISTSAADSTGGNEGISTSIWGVLKN